MIKLRLASVDDLPTLVRIHKLAYSKSHFTSLLPEDVLIRYYRYFINDDVEIWLAVDESVDSSGLDSPTGSPLGFAVFGFGIPEKISVFKRECRLDILLASLHYPLSTAKKIFRILVSRTLRVNAYSPADYLLLSIAVAKPRSGVGRSLLNALLVRARQKGCQSVGLYVNADNFGAINAYFSVGFSISDFQGGQFYMEKILE